MDANVFHTGGCHCGGVQFQYEGPRDQVAWDCNCSMCNMKRNTHVIVSKERFKVTKGEDLLTCYQFNTKTAKHLFCSVCGVCAFYVPRSNPEAYAITIYCVDPGTLGKITIKHFDGLHWEEAYAATGIANAAKE